MAVIQVEDRAAALADLERLHAALPDLACKGLCGHSCTQHVDASAAERNRLLLQDGGKPQPGTRRLLEHCMADPHAAHLMAAMPRGDPPPPQRFTACDF